MSDCFQYLNVSASSSLLVSPVVNSTGLPCGLFLCIILHLGDMEIGLGNSSIVGNMRNSYCGLQK